MQVKFALPRFTGEDALRLARECYGISGAVGPLPSERDQNFLLTSDSGEAYVLKIANVAEPVEILDLQNQAMARLAERAPDLAVPRVVASRSGGAIVPLPGPAGGTHHLRLLTWIPGQLWKDVRPHTPELLHGLGRVMGLIDRALEGFAHGAAERRLKWDVAHAGWIRDYLPYLHDPAERAIVERRLVQYDAQVLPRLPHLRKSVIYNDANDANVLVSEGDPRSRKVIGVIDFGDLVHSQTIGELAVACAYGMMGQPDPLGAGARIVAGYHEVFPLTEAELEVLHPLIGIRLCVSVTNAAYQRVVEPGNAYLTISERPAWDLLRKLASVPDAFAHSVFREACGLPPCPADRRRRDALTADDILRLRRRLLGRNLSFAYRKPIHIVRGSMQYLYDAEGRRYLDAVNNVAHVGHCHPRVVQAGQEQMAVLNTNSRYLHENVVRYAERLVATLPDPLRVVYFVCSGSEANELALRLARTYTRGRETIVVDLAYHGNSNSLIEVSPYKYEGPGGSGPQPFVHKVPVPDTYRGLYRGDPEPGQRYAQHVADAVGRIRERGGRPPTFLCESLMGSAGQIPLAPGYLREAYRHVRAAGGVCIADEIQVGLGRVGSDFWGFELQGVVPDIVTMGKPIGNGHPLGAVVTTPEIADAFNNGMEYFNSFGGNPVSCAIGQAVLEVIEQEGLQARALDVGGYLIDHLRRLQDRHPIIGDVRGAGLFIGVEFVRSRETRERALDEASSIVNRMKEQGILLSADFNSIKIKPPLVFTRADADLLVESLDNVLQEEGQPCAG